MMITELHSKNFNDAAEELSEICDCITDYESLKDFAKHQIDEDRLFLAVHILDAIHKAPADYYSYDYCMGTLETPTPLLVAADLEDYCEKEKDNETI